MRSILECENLSKYGTTKALDSITLHSQGRITGLLGPTEWKTTLIKSAMIFLLQQRKIRIGFEPGVETKKIVSYLPEKTYLNNWMKVSNLLIF